MLRRRGAGVEADYGRDSPLAERGEAPPLGTTVTTHRRPGGLELGVRTESGRASRVTPGFIAALIARAQSTLDNGVLRRRGAGVEAAARDGFPRSVTAVVPVSNETSAQHWRRTAARAPRERGGRSSTSLPRSARGLVGTARLSVRASGTRAFVRSARSYWTRRASDCSLFEVGNCVDYP